MTIKQLSIFVENKPGRLSDVTATLKKLQLMQYILQLKE